MKSKWNPEIQREILKSSRNPVDFEIPYAKWARVIPLGAACWFQMAANPTEGESRVLKQFYSQIEAVLDPVEVAKLLWQGWVYFLAN